MEQEFIVKWIEENGAATQEELFKNMAENYLEKGYVDSFGFLGLITECEEKFHISFSDEDFSDDAIFTIKGLVEKIKNAIEK